MTNTGTAISLHDTRDGDSYVISGADWTDRTNSWHEGDDGSTFVGTDTSAKIRVQLGIVDVERVAGCIGGPRVVWLRCLG